MIWTIPFTHLELHQLHNTWTFPEMAWQLLFLFLFSYKSCPRHTGYVGARTHATAPPPLETPDGMSPGAMSHQRRPLLAVLTGSAGRHDICQGTMWTVRNISLWNAWNSRFPLSKYAYLYYALPVYHVYQVFLKTPSRVSGEQSGRQSWLGSARWQ